MKKKSSPSKEKTNSKEKTKDKKPKEKTKKKSDEPKETSTSNINNNNNNNIETQIPNFNNNYYNQLSNNNNNITNNENNPSLKKCDGCYQGDSSVYCTNCDKFFCKICDDQIHVVPFNRSHIRKDINLLFQYKKNCYHHNTNPLLYYCDTCNEPICIDCKEKGPHNSNLHNVCNIIEIYKKKFYEIKNLIEMKIKDKLNENVNKINYYNYIGNCSRDYKENIEKNIRKEFNNKIENINGIFGKKLAIINYESSMLQKDFNVVIEICNFVNEITICDLVTLQYFISQNRYSANRLVFTTTRLFYNNVIKKWLYFFEFISLNQSLLNLFLTYRKIIHIINLCTS
jgi:hypothetical protein